MWRQSMDAIDVRITQVGVKSDQLIGWSWNFEERYAVVRSFKILSQSFQKSENSTSGGVNIGLSDVKKVIIL